MSDTPPLLAIYVDGETKTGKGAASKAIANTLEAVGYKVYYDVAGDFYRRYVALVRRRLRLDEAADLPTGEVLVTAATDVYKVREAYEKDIDLGDLQRSAISKSVSVLGELPVAQAAGAEWYALSVKRAVEAGADVMVLDGRNPRDRVEDELPKLGVDLKTALDLYMTCEPAEAARRAWRNRGVMKPTHEQVIDETLHVIDRRTRDRQRADRPFLQPAICATYDPALMNAMDAVQLSWQSQTDHQPPITIKIDNTKFVIDDMLATVTNLALVAVRFARST